MINLDGDTALTGKVLDALLVRAHATAENLVNKNTPGFKRYVVRFEDVLAQAKAAGKDYGDVEPIVERDTSGPAGANNVDMVAETTTLDQTRMLYDLFTRRVGSQFSTLNKAIFGR